MRRVFADRKGEFFAHRAFGGLGRVGRAKDIAIFPDRILALEHLDDDGPRGHRLDEFAEERPILVNRIKGFGLRAGHEDPLLGDDPQSRGLDHGIDRAGEIASRCVGLENGKGALYRHIVSCDP